MLSKEQFGQPIRNMFNNIADKFIDALYNKMSDDLSNASFLPKEQMEEMMQHVRDDCMQQVQAGFNSTLNRLKEANNGR